MEQNLTFADLGLSEEILQALEKKGYGYPTRIQAEAIPEFMQWKDVIAKAPTGTGKTFAFGIPMIEHIDAESEDLQGLTYYKNIRVAVVYGGAKIEGQIKQLKNHPQIVVATPGRLMDHYKRHTLSFDKVQTVVLDEADRMLDMGFFDDVTKIIEKVKNRRNLGLFSATISQEVMTVSWMYQRDEVEITVPADTDNRPDITQYSITCPPLEKIEMTSRLIRTLRLERTIVFCNTKVMCQRLSDDLKRSGPHGPRRRLHPRRYPAAEAREDHAHVQGRQAPHPDRDGRRLARHRRRRCGLRHQLRRAGGERVLYPPHRPHGPCPEKGHRRVHPRHVPGAGEAGGDREIFPLCHTAREIRGGRLPRRGGAAEAQKGAAAPPLPLTAAETGLLLLCCALPEAEDRPLTMAQFQEVAKRARALGPGGENPLRELTARDLERLGYSQEQCGRIVRLLSRETQLERYLRAAERNGIVPITRLSPRYPARLRQTLGQRCPAVLFAKGDETPLSMRCISVVGSRELTEGGRAFAEAAGRLIARSGYALCSGGAMGADRAAQEACLTAGGSAVVFPAGRLLDCPAQAHVLYLAEQGYDLPFSAQRALSRNHFIHAMGEKTLVAQCRAGAGGTWDGTTENLRRGWSPVFVSDDGSEGAQALIARGAVPVRTLSGLDDLQPAQLQF